MIESPLRDLARKLRAVARDHIAYSQVTALMDHVDEHLSALAFHQETNERDKHDCTHGGSP
jgi:hypothetical protein